jgi:predicted permease
MSGNGLSPVRSFVLDSCERAYRRLLICFPPDFRRAHGEDAARLFRDKTRAALRHGAVATVSALGRGIFDLLRESARERYAARRRAPASRAGLSSTAAGDSDRALPAGHAAPARKEGLMDSFAQDARFAARMLRKQPGVTALVVVTLALGIGANTTVFSFVKAMFLNPLAVGDVDTLVAVHGTVEEGSAPDASHFPISWPNYRDLREQNDSLSGLAAWGFAQAGIADDAEEPQFEAAELVSANYFDVLGVSPARGRFFRPQEEEPAGAHPVTVISHSLWQERYNAEDDIVGRRIRINGHPFTIVGVAPQGFGGTNVLFDVRLWAPISMHPQMHAYSEFVEQRRWRMFQLAGRLREGVTIARAEADLRTIAARLADEYPDDNRGRLTQLTPLAQAAIDPNQREGFVRSSAFLLAVTGIVLLIACANVANLMLARARGRGREIAVRLSLGAGRWRIVRQLAWEAFLLAGLGGLASIGVAVAGRELLWAYRPPFLSEVLEIGIDLEVLVFTAVLATATGLAFALAPALRATRVDAATTLREGATAAADRRGRWMPVRSALVVAQVALSFVAVIGAGLFLSSLRQAQRIDPGFPAARLLLVPLSPAAQGYTQERSLQFYEELEARLQALPQVENVGFGSNPPLTPTFVSRTTIREGDLEDQAVLIGTNAVSAGFFDAMQLPLLSGRTFDAGDDDQGRRVIVINDVMARRFWPDENPLGRRVRFLGEQGHLEVVGVVGSIKYNSLGEEPQPYFYQPVRQQFADAGTFHVRTSDSPTAVAEPVRTIIRELDPQLPLAAFQTATDQIELSLWAPRMGASLLSVFGFLSLTLALVGIYGVLVQLVGERTREIGIRMALGAGRRDVVRLIAAQTLRWMALGGVIGVGGALAASGWVGSFLYGIGGGDPTTYLGTAVLLVLAGLAAASVPARRAAGVDPAVTMRQE